ncbi:MAG: efflux RND transporter periplasmic adaptor subunit [Verrucomicrobia bacterium]|nr:efflux RND transporter periplasmic adaptor subunit [Verrucomicrobiota bacterium]MDE3100376.1 efflux RND transporter periplasmic adaptor subunit [Verrucomicrobiota bacterium]
MKCLVQAKAAAALAIFAAIVLFQSGCSRGESTAVNPPQKSDSTSNAPAEAAVELSGDQLNAIQIAPVGTYAFTVIKTGIGSIDFENNLYSDPSLSTQVFPPVAGNIVKVFVELGDEVQKDAPLYSIENSATNQAETVVRSPIAGQITSVNATPGLFVSPSSAPAPVSVADVSTKWLLANVPEAGATLYRVGQPLKVTVASFPGRVFGGKISKIYPAVDLSTHRLTIRADISDPANELREGMLADFSAQAGKPVESAAIPADGVVREGDGAMTAWVTTDRRHFTQVIVKIGLREDGEAQILDGLRPGELAVTNGAIFLDNMLQAPPSD